VYASWAELFFGILYVLELAWILRALRLDERERWLALFLFAGANWIARITSLHRASRLCSALPFRDSAPLA